MKYLIFEYQYCFPNQRKMSLNSLSINNVFVWSVSLLGIYFCNKFCVFYGVVIDGYKLTLIWVWNAAKLNLRFKFNTQEVAQGHQKYHWKIFKESKKNFVQNSTTLWNVKPCSAVELNRYFVEIYYIQNRRREGASISTKQRTLDQTYLT
jgi:hypothetical protein